MEKKKIEENLPGRRPQIKGVNQKQTGRNEAGQESDRKQGGHTGEIGSIPLGLGGQNRRPVPQKTFPTRHRRQKRGSVIKPKKKRSWIGFLLITILGLIGIYFLGSFFLVPTFIKGPIAGRLASQTGLDIRISRVFYSPFTFSLKLSDVTVFDKKKSGHDLSLSVKHLAGNVSLVSFFQKQGVIKKLIVDGFDLKFARYQGTDTSLSRPFERLAANYPEEKRIDLKWLFPRQLEVKDSSITIDDKQTGKQHFIEHLDLIIPPLDTSGDSRETAPSLKAVVNSSPVEITGQRQKKEDGTIETLLTLQSKQINVADYIGYLPSFENSASLTGGSGALDLEIVFSGNIATERKISLRGKLQLKDMELRTQNNDSIVKLPSAFFSIKVDPLTGQYQFENILFKGLEWNASTKSTNDWKRILPSFFEYINRLPGGVRIDQLLVDQGIFRFTTKSGKQKKTGTWEDVKFFLKDYENPHFNKSVEGPSRQASFVFSGLGKNNKTDMNFLIKGIINNSMIIEGDISATNVTPNFYLPFFIKNIPIGIDGRGEIKSGFRYQLGIDPQNELQLYEGEFSLFDFSIYQKEKVRISGKEFICKTGRLNVLENKLTCERIVLENSKINGDWWEKILQKPAGKNKGSWQVLCNNLDISKSTLYGAIKENGDKNDQIELNNFTLKAGQLLKSDDKKANIDVIAQVGKQGRIHLSGYYNMLKKEGSLLTVFNDINLFDIKPFYYRWFKPDVLQGRIYGQGTLNLPAARFDGKVRVEGFVSGLDGKQMLSWQKASSPDVAIFFSPLKLMIDSLQVENPVFSGPKIDLETGSGLFFKSDFDEKNGIMTPKSYAEIKEVTIENGSCRYPFPLLASGFYPDLKDIKGRLTGIGPDKEISFDLKGRLNSNSSFSVTGETGLYELYNYQLNVDKVPLSLFGSIFKKRANIDTTKATASWRQILTLNGDEKVYTSHVDIKGLKPMPGSSYSETLALLADEKDLLSIDLKYGRADSNFGLLMENVLQYLGRSRVKAAISPLLLLKQSFSELNFPEKISFKIGTDKTEQLEGLQNYALLLGKRPGLRLLLTGGYDEENDKKVLHQKLFAQARKKREIEIAQWREKESRRLEERKKQLEDIKKDSKEVVVEKLDYQELNRGMPSMVTEKDIKVSQQLLEELAKQRVEAVRAYLDEVLGLDETRVVQSSKFDSESASVSVQIKPKPGQ